MKDDRGDLKSHISTLLVQLDPMRIYFKDIDNRDEYDPEAVELARLLPSCVSRIACHDAAHGVFVKYFGDLIISRAVSFEALADELWALRQKFLGPSTRGE